MHIDISSVVVEEHRRRLREDAQDPAPRLALRLWILVTRRHAPALAPAVSLPSREVERLAA